MDRTVAIILGGGRGTRLYPLTKPRSKPAVPFGGMYRLIDIPVSNCLNSDVNRIFVVTQFNSASLNRHVTMTYNFDAFRDGFVSILAAEQTLDHSDWLQGTADAVRKNLRHVGPSKASDILILSGDHIYWMDYRPMLSMHRRVRADITVATIPVPVSLADRFGIMNVNSEGRITQFCEKPMSRSQIAGWELSSSVFGRADRPTNESVVMASMGIYILRNEAIGQILDESMGSDFGKHVIPNSIASLRVYAYPFSGYWEDIGTIKSYYEANLALTETHPKFELYDPNFRLFTRPRFLPGTSLRNVKSNQVMICAGCRIENADIEHSIIGLRSIIKTGVQISESVIVGADSYETPDALDDNRDRKRPDMGIGGDTLIRKAIVDKDARIGYGVKIDPGENHPDADGPGYAVRDGIVIIEKNAEIPDGTVIPTK